jgi:glycosyltransferase involved in cell wall biosynthesis
MDLCIKSIQNQIWPKVEAIIVDQGSTDRTQEIARSYGVSVAVLKKTHDFYTPPSYSRNHGASLAHGKYILHIDADMELDSNLIDECVKKCENETVDAIVIHEYDIGKGFWALSKALERRCYIGDPEMEAARFERKEVFDRIGGYDASVSSGEDWDFHARLLSAGFKIATLETAGIRHHIGRISFIKQVKKKYSYGKTIGNYVAKRKGAAWKQISPIRSAYVRNVRVLVKDPAHLLGFLILRTSENAAAAIAWTTTKFVRH